MFYHYVFYYIYRFVMLTPRKNDAGFATIFLMVLPVMLNLGFVETIMFHYYRVSRLDRISHTIIFLILVFVNYLAFYNKEKYLKIVGEIEKQTDNKKIKWKWIMIIYGVLTLAFFFISPMINGNR
jgi:hypothetical protein